MFYQFYQIFKTWFFIDSKIAQHVQFADEGSTRGHNADIQVQVMNQYLIKVHLGFLQVKFTVGIVVFNFNLK